MAARKRDMTIREAVGHLPGMSKDTLMKWLRDAYMQKCRPCPFGEAIVTEKGVWQYYIFPERLRIYLSGEDMIPRISLEDLRHICSVGTLDN